MNVAVFSSAEEVELFLNGASVGRKKAGEALAAGMPNSFVFETVYEPGSLEAVSFSGGKEVSRDTLSTSGVSRALRLLPEKAEMCADGQSLIYVPVEIVDENGQLVPDAAVQLCAEVSGDAAVLAGFGSGNPITDENYTKGSFTAYRGRALAILRSSYTAGEAVLTVRAEGFEPVSVEISVK